MTRGSELGTIAPSQGTYVRAAAITHCSAGRAAVAREPRSVRRNGHRI